MQALVSSMGASFLSTIFSFWLVPVCSRGREMAYASHAPLIPLRYCKSFIGDRLPGVQRNIRFRFESCVVASTDIWTTAVEICQFLLPSRKNFQRGSYEETTKLNKFNFLEKYLILEKEQKQRYIYIYT